MIYFGDSEINNFLPTWENIQVETWGIENMQSEAAPRSGMRQSEFLIVSLNSAPRPPGLRNSFVGGYAFLPEWCYLWLLTIRVKYGKSAETIIAVTLNCWSLIRTSQLTSRECSFFSAAYTAGRSHGLRRGPGRRGRRVNHRILGLEVSWGALWGRWIYKVQRVLLLLEDFHGIAWQERGDGRYILGNALLLLVKHILFSYLSPFSLVAHRHFPL